MQLIRRFVVDARLHQRRRHAVRVGGDIGVDKAARIRRYRDIERQRDRRRQLAEPGGKLIDHLAAGCTLGMHAVVLSEALIARMVVDGEIDPGFELLGIVGEQIQRRKIDRDDRLIVEVVRHPKLLNIRREMLRGLAVVENARGLAHLTQNRAQRRGAADGIAVRTAVRQDQVVVVRAEKLRRFLNRHSCDLSFPLRCRARNDRKKEGSCRAVFPQPPVRREKLVFRSGRSKNRFSLLHRPDQGSRSPDLPA